MFWKLFKEMQKRSYSFEFFDEFSKQNFYIFFFGFWMHLSNNHYEYSRSAVSVDLRKLEAP